MKTPRVLRNSIATLLCLAAASHAATLTWDGGPLASPTDDIITPGSGTWATGVNNWDDGIANSLNAAWANGDDAVFGGTAGTVTISGGVTANSVTFNSGYTIAGSTLTLSGATPTITANAVIGGISSSIAGSNGLTLTSVGTAGVYLDGNNTYTGVTMANSGFLIARNAGSLGSSADGTVVASGATLQIEAIGLADVNIANESLTISGTGMLGNRGALANWAGNNTWGGSVTMAAHSSIFTQAGTLTVNGVVGGAGFNLSKTGAGQLTLGGSTPNTYSGTTTVDLGTLALGKTGGAKAIIGPVTMGGANANQPNLRMLANNQFDPSVVMTFVNAAGNWARFDLQGTSQTLAGIQNTTGGGIVQNERVSGGGTSTAGTLTIDNSVDYSFNGYIRDRDGGAGTYFLNIVKTGAGKQTIAGGNVSYTGTTTVNGGTLELDQTTNYNSSTTVNTGGTFRNIGAGSDDYGAATLTLNGGAYTHATTAADAWRVWNGGTGPLTVGAAGGTINVENTNTTNNNVFFDGGIAGGGNLTLNTTGGANNGIVFRNQVGSYSGDVQVNSGNLFVNGSAGLVLQNSNVTLAAGGTLRLDANWASSAANASVKSLNGAGTVTLGGQTLTAGTNNGSGAFAGVIGGTGGLIKTGTGSQTLSGANTFTGPTSVNNGTLELDYGTQDNSKLSNTSALTLGGAALTLSGGSHPEIVLSTTLTAGTSSSITRSSGGAVIQLNTITRNAGASLNFNAPGIATTDNANDASGILGTWATVGGDWAMNSTGGADGAITAYAAYTDVDRLGGAIANAAASNVRIIEAGGGTNVTLAAGGTTTINSLVQGAAGGAATVDIGAGNTLRLGAAGGILLPSGNPAITFSNGTLTAGGADDTAGNLDVNNLSTSTGITIDSAITNNGTGAISLTKLGAGAVTVTGTNSHTGGTNIIGGTLAFNNGSLGTTGTITVAAGTLRWNGSNTEDVSARTALVNGLTATFDTNGNNVAFASAIGGATSAAVTKAGNGTLTLSGANTHTGVTTVQGGTLALNNVGALQNSTLDTGTAGSQAVTFAIAGNNTYNVGGLQGADALEIGGNTVSIGANNTNTNFSGVLSGAGGALTKVGTGVLTLSGAAPNTFNGATTFASNGQLILSKTGGAVAIPGDLIMAAPGSRGIVSATQDNQFGPGSVLRFAGAGDSRFELKGTTQTFGGIENSAAPAHTFHAIQHSEFGSVAAVDTTSQLILDVAGANSFNFVTTANGQFRDYYGGTVSLVKNGTGTQILTGAGVTYSGTTAVNAGTLELANATGYNSNTTVANNANVILSNTAAMAMGGGAAFTLNNGATLTHNGVTTNAAHITLAGPFTVAGTTTINQNSVANVSGANKNLFLDGGLHGSGTLTIAAANPGNAVEFRNNNSTFAGTIIVNGIASTTVNAGSGISVGGTTTALQNADITVNGTMEMLNQGLGWAGAASGDFAMGALNGTGVVVANFTGGGETRFKVGNTGNSGNFSGIIADGVGNRVTLTKLGAGTQILAGANTYTGTTTISGGTLQVGNGGTSGTIGNGAIANNAALVVDRSDAVSINGAISGTGSVTKNGAGTLTLTNNSTYQGATTVNAGTLKLGASQTLTVSSAIWLDATDSGTITTNGSGGVTTWANKGTLLAAGNATAPAGQEPVVATLVGAMNNQSVIRFDSTAGGGAPFDRLTNATNFAAGNVTVMYAGRLNGGDSNLRLVGGLANNWLLGTWNGNSESAFFNNGFLNNTTPADAISRIYTGTIATGGAAKFYINGAERGSGAAAQGPNGLILGGGFNATENSDGDIGELLVFNSVLTSEERGAVEAYLNRKWKSGNTNVLPATTALSLTTAGATLDVNGVTQTVGSISGVTGTSITLGGGALTVGDTTPATFSGVISGTGTITKVGTGTWTLSGANTYTGATTISGGTLEAAGAASLGTTTGVVIATGGTLLLSGTGNQVNDAAPFTMNGGTIRSTVNGLSEQFGTLTLTENSVIDFGSFALGNTFRFADSAALSALWTTGKTLSIWNWTPGVDHLYVGTTTGGLTASQLGKISFYSGAPGSLSNGFPGGAFNGTPFDGLNGEVSPVPEPSSVFAAMGLLGLIGWRERRKERHARWVERRALAERK